MVKFVLINDNNIFTKLFVLQIKQQIDTAAFRHCFAMNQTISTQFMVSCCSVPDDRDVLCGQTSLARNHPGNVFLRQLILSKVDDYSRANEKAQKGVIIFEILKELETNCVRFMKFNKKENHWVTISSMEAREKVSHAIRDRVRERKIRKINASTKNKMILQDVNTNLKETCKLKPASNKAKDLLVSPPSPIMDSRVNHAFTLGGATPSPHHVVVSEDDDASLSSDVSLNTSWFTPSSVSMPLPEFVTCFSAAAAAPAGDRTTKNMMAHASSSCGNTDCNSATANFSYLLDQHPPLGTMTMMDDDGSSVDIDDYNELMLSDIIENNGVDHQQEDTEFMISLLHAACSNIMS
jgi:hypothetical protein